MSDPARGRRWAPPPSRLFGWVLALMLGLGTGLGAVVWHSHWWGLLLAAAATASTVTLLPGGARAAFVIGWWIPVARAAIPTRAGDVLVLADAPGYALLIGGFALALGVMLTSVGRAPRRGDSEIQGPSA